MIKNKQPIYIYRESVAASWARDAGTFGAVIGSFWVNHTYLASNNWLDFFLFIMGILGIFSFAYKARSKRVRLCKTPDEAIEYLRSLRSPQSDTGEGDG